jgi:hypothetical protein
MTGALCVTFHKGLAHLTMQKDNVCVCECESRYSESSTLNNSIILQDYFIVDHNQ